MMRSFILIFTFLCLNQPPFAMEGVESVARPPESPVMIHKLAQQTGDPILFAEYFQTPLETDPKSCPLDELKLYFGSYQRILDSHILKDVFSPPAQKAYEAFIELLKRKPSDITLKPDTEEAKKYAGLKLLPPNIHKLHPKLRKLDGVKLAYIHPHISFLTKLKILNIEGFTLSMGQLKGLEELKLRKDTPAHFLAGLRELTNLEKLDLTNNELTQVPLDACFLPLLEELDLSDNQVSSVPLEFSQLARLTHLNLRKNKLTEIKEVGQLSKLIELLLAHNQITVLPKEVWNFSSLTKLDLSNNKLTTIPSKISRLSQLKELYLDNNQLAALPQQFWDLITLTALNLSNNRLAVLPPEIRRLSQLKELYLDNNQLATLPKELEELILLKTLSLDDNLVARLSSRLYQLTPQYKIKLSNSFYNRGGNDFIISYKSRPSNSDKLTHDVMRTIAALNGIEYR